MVAACALMALIAGCSPGDPTARVLEQRARWSVELLDWAARDDGAISFSVRVSGPPRSSLEKLTFRVGFYGAGGQPIGTEWRTIDLTQIPRGAPTDMLFVAGPLEQAVEGLAVELVLRPTTEERAHIPELQLQP